MIIKIMIIFANVETEEIAMWPWVL